MRKSKKISRRKFIVSSILGGTGVILGTAYFGRNAIRREVNQMINSGVGPYSGDVESPTLWFEITNKSKVLFHCPKVEMGQGTFTGLAQIAADELEIDINQMQVVHAATASGNIDGGSTGGSTSIASLWQPLRELAATMREMLKIEAAKKLGVTSDQVVIKNGQFSTNGKIITFGETVDGVEEWEIPEVPKLKDLKDYKFIGKPIPRVDLIEKVMGAPIYGMDAAMPNMVYGAVVRPTHIGAKFNGVDTSKAATMPGVIKIVEHDDFVGVVAHSRIEVENAKKAIEVNWKIEKTWQTKDIEDLIKVGSGTPFIIQKEGKTDDVFDNNEIVTAEYSSPIGAHAQLEPNGAVAFVEKDKATVMVSTQVVKITQQEVADSLGLDVEQVNIIPTYLGGGFGRRLHTPNAMQAAILSQAVGKPVKCFFNRKEEFQNDTFRPPTHHVLKAKLDAEGKIEAIEHNVSSGDVMYGSPLVPGIAEPLLGADIGAWRGGMIQYGKIPHYQAISWRVKLPFATSWWRSLGLLANTFAIESFIDELAIKAGKNPAQFRLEHIQNNKAGNRLKKVIETAVKKSGYINKPNNGVAMGLAASTDAGTPVAHVAEVSIEANKIVVHKVTCVIDVGLAINPDQIRAQCEGSIIMGLSAVMYEHMFVKDGQLRPVIYGPYKMAMMKHAPKEINVVILENDNKPGAVGEPPMGPIGAAIANAVFRLTRKRLRNMPLE